MTSNTARSTELLGENPPKAPNLFVIPCAPGRAFVWCSPRDEGSISKITIDHATIDILERKKLFRPGHNLEVLLVEGDHLHDGSACVLHVASASGQQASIEARACLARWSDADTARILKLIVNRFANTGPSPVMERYLSFISVWQAPARILQSFPDGCLVAVDLECDRLESTIFCLTDEGLRSDQAQLLVNRQGTWVLWLNDRKVQHLYLATFEALIRVAIGTGGTDNDSPLADSTAGFGLTLIEGLHRNGACPSRHLAAWLHGQCPTIVGTMWHETRIEVRGAVRLTKTEAAIFVTVTGGSMDVEPMRVEAFGSTEALPVRIAACDPVGDAAACQRLLVVRVTVPETADRCYRLTWFQGEHAMSAWIRETDLGGHEHEALARLFHPVAAVDPAVFPEVLYPIATAPAPYEKPGIVALRDIGAARNEGLAEAVIFAGRDLEALHRTVLAIALSSASAPPGIHICLWDPQQMDNVIAQASVWQTLYSLTFRITCYSPRGSEAQVAHHLLSGEVPRILCRAGAVPRARDWLSTILAKLRAADAPILLGSGSNAGYLSEGGSGSSDVGRATVTVSAVQQAIVAAVPANYCPRPETDLRCYTLEGFLLTDVNGSSENRDPWAQELSFVQSGSADRPDDFWAKLDHHTLSLLNDSSQHQPHGPLETRTSSGFEPKVVAARAR